MYNWNINTEEFKKNPKKYNLWRFIQLINFGLDNDKLDEAEIKQKWDNIKDQIDPYKRRALEYLIWGKLYSLPNKLNFWSLSPKMNK